MNSNNRTGVKLIIYILIFAIVIVVVYFAYSFLKDKYSPAPFTFNIPNESGSKSTGDKDNRTKAPEFMVYNKQGEEVNFTEFIGKPVVINFWATWCPYCVAEMEDFNEVYLELKDDVHFMMINQTDGARETKKKADDYIKEKGFEFLVYYDLDFSASTVYGIQYLPTTVFIDSEGNFVTGYSGPISKDKLKNHLNDLRKE